MTNTGWVRIYRQIENNRFWLSEPFSKGQAWIDLVIFANHQDGWFFVRGNKVDVKRGQIGWSELTMAKRWHWSRNKVRNFLKLLKKEQQITQYKSSITTILTIINYDKFQPKRTTDDTTEGQQKDNRKYTNNNVKNVKNEKNTHMGGQKKLNVPELLNSKENSKKGLFPCTPLEIWEVAMYLRISKDKVKRKHDRIMRLINSGEFQVKYPKNKTTYNTLLDWLESDVERGQIETVNDIELEVLKIQKPYESI